MDYEAWSHFAQNWGTVYFVAIFAVALLYALWPRNGRDFRQAAQLPLTEKDNGDDRPIA
jgi:cytochrome c oxidase cbb3-type subunit IV